MFPLFFSSNFGFRQDFFLFIENQIENVEQKSKKRNNLSFFQVSQNQRKKGEEIQLHLNSAKTSKKFLFDVTFQKRRIFDFSLLFILKFL